MKKRLRSLLMSKSNKTVCFKGAKIFFVMCVCVISTLTNAATVDITTEYSADRQRPSNNTFINTTPITGFCKNFPEECSDDDFSIIIPGLSARKYFDSLSSDINLHHPAIGLDGTTRALDLIDAKTGNVIPVHFRLSFFGLKHSKVDSSEPASMFDSMTGTGISPSGGCSGRIGHGSLDYYEHGWGVPQRKLTCYKKLNHADGPFQMEVKINNFSFGYNLTTPDPLNVYSGNYEGELIYTVGDNGDINFHAEETSDSEIRIRIKATVRHIFNFKFAPGSENVSLTPTAGWDQWINGGRVPDSLSKQVPFSLSSSTKFIVNMQCQYTEGQGCALHNTLSGESVPLEVAMTLPGFKSNGVDVNNTLLTTISSGHSIDSPGTYISDRRSHIDFRVRRPAVEKMVKSPGSSWKGIVTLIFDAQTE